MPAFRFLSDEDAEAAIDYVQGLASRGELELTLIREATDELSEEDKILVNRARSSSVWIFPSVTALKVLISSIFLSWLGALSKYFIAS